MKALKFRDTPEAIDESLAVEFEQLIGSRLPGGYRQFILQTNGGVLTRENSWFPIVAHPDFLPEVSGVAVRLFLRLRCERYPTSRLDENFETYHGRVPFELIPVADTPSGDLILLGIRHSAYNRVFFWDHENEGFETPSDPYKNVGRLADSFEEFVDALRAPDSQAPNILLS